MNYMPEIIMCGLGTLLFISIYGDCKRQEAKRRLNDIKKSKEKVDVVKSTIKEGVAIPVAYSNNVIGRTSVDVPKRKNNDEESGLALWMALQDLNIQNSYVSQTTEKGSCRRTLDYTPSSYSKRCDDDIRSSRSYSYEDTPSSRSSSYDDTPSSSSRHSSSSHSSSTSCHSGSSSSHSSSSHSSSSNDSCSSSSSWDSGSSSSDSSSSSWD